MTNETFIYNICYEKGDDVPGSATKPVEKQTPLALLHVYWLLTTTTTS